MLFRSGKRLKIKKINNKEIKHFTPFNKKSIEKIFESEINSFFQSNLFEILPKEKKLYDIYDDLLKKTKNGIT